MEFSRRIIGLAEECLRCDAVFPIARRTCDGNAFLVAIQHAKASIVVERTNGPVGRAPEAIRICMKDIIVRLWPTEPIPGSYFGLVRRLVDAVPRIDAVKWPTCIGGARMALARVKTY